MLFEETSFLSGGSILDNGINEQKEELLPQSMKKNKKIRKQKTFQDRVAGEDQKFSLLTKPLKKDRQKLEDK